MEGVCIYRVLWIACYENCFSSEAFRDTDYNLSNASKDGVFSLANFAVDCLPFLAHAM